MHVGFLYYVLMQVFYFFLIKKILKFPVVWYLNVCGSANALFEYD